jgi:hypothetical protein
VLAARGDLWLDEIWSLYLLRNAKQLWDVLSIQHDNNHILNSAWLFLIGPHGSSLSYRLLSIVSGSAAAAAMGAINLRWGLTAGLVTIMLAAFSFPLIQYSSEARGYAPAMLFALSGYVFLRQAILKKSKWSIAWFQASVLLGMLSHPTYLYVYAGFLAWMMAGLIREAEDRKRALVRLAGWNFFPALGIVVLYFFFIRGMTIGGGDERSLVDVLASLSILVSGAPAVRPAEILGVIVAGAGFVLGIVVVKRESGDEWIFFLFSILLAPLLFWLAVGPAFLYERYFMLGVPFYLLMAGRALAALLRVPQLPKRYPYCWFCSSLPGTRSGSSSLQLWGAGGTGKLWSTLRRKLPETISSWAATTIFATKWCCCTIRSSYRPESGCCISTRVDGPPAVSSGLWLTARKPISGLRKESWLRLWASTAWRGIFLTRDSLAGIGLFTAVKSKAANRNMRFTVSQKVDRTCNI